MNAKIVEIFKGVKAFKLYFQVDLYDGYYYYPHISINILPFSWSLSYVFGDNYIELYIGPFEFEIGW